MAAKDFYHEHVKMGLDEKVNLIVFDVDKLEIVKWIN